MKNHEELYNTFIQTESQEKQKTPNSSCSQLTINSMFKINHQIKINITSKQLN